MLINMTGSAATEYMHDVIGNDGTVPAAFRALVREEISQYPSVASMNGTQVCHLEKEWNRLHHDRCNWYTVFK